MFSALILILLSTSIIKLINNLVSVDENKITSNELNKSNNKIKYDSKWRKNIYIVPKNQLISLISEKIFEIGNKYFIIHEILNEDRCFLGIFSLDKIQNNNLYFSYHKRNVYSRLKNYSEIKLKKIFIIISSEENFRKLENMQNCSEWVKIENN